MASWSERFGAAVAGSLGTGPGRNTLAAQRARFLVKTSSLAPLRARRRRRALQVFAVGALVVAASVWLSAPGALSAEWRGQSVAERDLVEPPAAGAEALTLSDGSRVLVLPSARLQVRTLSSADVVLVLERGRVEAEVTKREGRRWAIMAGPYTVSVVGTRFSVEWERARESLVVSVTEGRVAVSGGDVGRHGVLVGPGQRFVAGGSPQVPAAPPSAATEPPSTPVESAPEPRSPSAPSAAPAPNDDWASLARNGKYKEALAVASHAGFDQLLETLPEGELLLLANTARYAGDSVRARRALLRIRERYPRGTAAALSALHLARVAEDSQRNLPEAARWLKTFLSEAPPGDLAASARASLLGIMLRTGDAAGARSAAQQYLDHHPRGPHAKEARAVLAQQPR